MKTSKETIKRIWRWIPPLITILFWSIVGGWIGSFFDLYLPMIIVGLAVGSGFALFGELVNNWLARSLTLVTLVSALPGGVAAYLFIIPKLTEHFFSILPEDGHGVPAIVGLPWFIVHFGAGIGGVILGAIIGSLLGLVSAAVVSILMWLRRRMRGRSSNRGKLLAAQPC